MNNKIRILVVDDNENIRRVITSMLKEMDFSVVLDAQDGKAALNIILQSYEAEKPIHLVICDWKMPNMSGLELVKKIRKTPHLKFTKFLMVTNESNRDKVLEALSLAIDDYLIKPFNQATFKTKLVNVLKD